MTARTLRALFLAIATALLLSACAPGGMATDGEAQSASAPGAGPDLSHPATEIYKPVPLLWEGQAGDALLWSALSFRIIGGDTAPLLLPGSLDVTKFCPAYAHLSEPEAVNFWAFLVSAIAKFESGFDPKARAVDDEGGEMQTLEGLLHLSLKDIRDYPFCAVNATAETARNLDCGIKILAAQVVRTGKISSNKVKWKVLRPSGERSRLKEILDATRALPFCAKRPATPEPNA